MQNTSESSHASKECHQPNFSDSLIQGQKLDFSDEINAERKAYTCTVICKQIVLFKLKNPSQTIGWTNRKPNGFYKAIQNQINAQPGNIKQGQERIKHKLHSWKKAYGKNASLLSWCLFQLKKANETNLILEFQLQEEKPNKYTEALTEILKANKKTMKETEKTLPQSQTQTQTQQLQDDVFIAVADGMFSL